MFAKNTLQKALDISDGTYNGDQMCFSLTEKQKKRAPEIAAWLDDPDGERGPSAKLRAEDFRAMPPNEYKQLLFKMLPEKNATNRNKVTAELAGTSGKVIANKTGLVGKAKGKTTAPQTFKVGGRTFIELDSDAGVVSDNIDED
jgi:hypothetical protein